MSYHPVNYLVYSKQGEAVFEECLVKIYKIYVGPPLPVQFNNQYRIG